MQSPSTLTPNKELPKLFKVLLLHYHTATWGSYTRSPKSLYFDDSSILQDSLTQSPWAPKATVSVPSICRDNYQEVVHSIVCSRSNGMSRSGAFRLTRYTWTMFLELNLNADLYLLKLSSLIQRLIIVDDISWHQQWHLPLLSLPTTRINSCSIR